MDLATCTPRLWTYLMLECLVTVPVTDKVDRKMKNDQISLESFIMENELQIDRYFGSYLLPLVNYFPLVLMRK